MKIEYPVVPVLSGEYDNNNILFIRTHSEKFNCFLVES